MATNKRRKQFGELKLDDFFYAVERTTGKIKEIRVDRLIRDDYNIMVNYNTLDKGFSTAWTFSDKKYFYFTEKNTAYTVSMRTTEAYIKLRKEALQQSIKDQIDSLFDELQNISNENFEILRKNE